MESDSPDRKTNEVSKLKRTIENLTGQIRNLKGRGARAPVFGKGKGSGRGGRGVNLPRVKMPAELVGQPPTTDNGDPICFS